MRTPGSPRPVRPPPGRSASSGEGPPADELLAHAEPVSSGGLRDARGLRPQHGDSRAERKAAGQAAVAAAASNTVAMSGWAEYYVQRSTPAHEVLTASDLRRTPCARPWPARRHEGENRFPQPPPGRIPKSELGPPSPARPRPALRSRAPVPAHAKEERLSKELARGVEAVEPDPVDSGSTAGPPRAATRNPRCRSGL